MFAMPVHLFEQYCEWIFAILFMLENEIDTSSYDPYQKRTFGFLAERLFNVWLEYQKTERNLRIKEIQVVNLEGENIYLKGINMLFRKFKAYA